MARLAMTFDGHALHPANRAARLVCDGWRRGEVYMVTASRPRNLKHHRMFWAFCTYIANALNDGPGALSASWSPEQVAERIKLHTGHAETMRLPAREAKKLGVEYVIRAKSISFASMDQEAFSAFFDAALAFVIVDLCPYLMDGPDKQEIEAIIAGSRPQNRSAA